MTILIKTVREIQILMLMMVEIFLPLQNMTVVWATIAMMKTVKFHLLLKIFALDGIDQNCDNLESCYIDSDNDGYGSQEDYIASNHWIVLEKVFLTKVRTVMILTHKPSQEPQNWMLQTHMKDSDDDGYGDMCMPLEQIFKQERSDDSRNDVNLTAGEYPGTISIK